MMFEPLLICNFPKCKAEITEEANVTRCSHIFCKAHIILGSGIDKRCPACGAILEGNYDVIHNHVNPPEEMKSMLMGYSPEKIFKAMSSGLLFWSFQMQVQKMHQQSTVEHLRRRLAKRESEWEKLEVDIKHYQQLQQQKVNHLQNELNALKNTLITAEKELNKKEHHISNLQSKYDKLQRQSAALMITGDLEPMESEMPKQQQQTLFQNREPSPPTPRFVFRPNVAFPPTPSRHALLRHLSKTETASHLRFPPSR